MIGIHDVSAMAVAGAVWYREAAHDVIGWQRPSLGRNVPAPQDWHTEEWLLYTQSRQ